MKKMSDEKLQSLYQKAENQNLTIIKMYNRKENNKTRKYIDFICDKHQDKGVIAQQIERFVNNKKICPYCNHSKLKETFKDEMSVINPDIEILSEYKNWETTILCKCRKCGYEWQGHASTLLSGGGCRECGYKKIWANRDRKTTEEAKKEIEEKFEHIEVIGEYIGYHEKIKCYCKIHDYIWEPLFASLLYGRGYCPLCFKESMNDIFSLSNEEFQKRMELDYPHIIPLDDYINRNQEMRFHCTEHDEDFVCKPYIFLNRKRKGCDKCCQSLGEIKMNSVLKKLNCNPILQFVFPDCKYEKALKFDAYDKELNIAFEYQGQQHYEPVNFNGMSKEQAQIDFELNQKRDNVKREYCKDNGINLIEIPYWEYDNMENYISQKIKDIRK